MSDNPSPGNQGNPKSKLYEEMLMQQIRLSRTFNQPPLLIPPEQPQIQPINQSQPNEEEKVEEQINTYTNNIDQFAKVDPQPEPIKDQIEPKPIQPVEEKKELYVNKIEEAKRDPDSEYVTLNAYCFHPNIKEFNQCFIYFRVMKYNDSGRDQQFSQMQMDRLPAPNDNFVFTQIIIHKNQWDTRYGIEYYYSLKDTFTYESEPIQRRKQHYNQLSYYFDTPMRFYNSIRRKQYTNLRPDDALGEYLGLFLKEYNQLEKSSIYLQFERFCKSSDIDLNYKALFQSIESFVQYEEYDAEKFMIFLFHVLYYTIRIRLKPNNRFYFKKAINAIHDIYPKDSLLKMYDSFKTKQSQNGSLSQLTERGIQTIVDYSPVITIQFINKELIIPDIKAFLQLVLEDLKDNHYQFKYIHNMIDMVLDWGNKHKLAMILIKYCLQVCFSLDDLLVNMRKYWLNPVDSQPLFEQKFKILKDNKKIDALSILKNLAEILQNEYGSVFIQDVEKLINEKPKDVLPHLMSCDSISFKALLKLAQNTSEHSFGTFKQLLKISVKSPKLYCTKKELLQIYKALAENILSTTDNLIELQTKVLLLIIDILEINECSHKNIKYEKKEIKAELYDLVRQTIQQIRDPVIFPQIVNFYWKVKQQKKKFLIFDRRILEVVRNLDNIISIQQLLTNIMLNQVLIQMDQIIQIVIELLQTLEKIFDNMTLEQIFTDDVLLKVIQLEKDRYFQNHKFSERIIQKVQDFIFRMKKSKVYMYEIERFLVNKQCKNLEQVLLFVDPNFKFNAVFVPLISEYKVLNQNLEKYENFITFALKLRHVVNTDKYEARLRNLRKLIQETYISELRETPAFRYFEQFDSMDFLFHFRESNVFSNTFNLEFHDLRYEVREGHESSSSDEEIMRMEEELKVGEVEEAKADEMINPAADRNDKYSIKDFDSLVEVAFIIDNNAGLHHYIKLMNYEISTLTYRELSDFWEKIQDIQVENEINIIFQYMNRDNDYAIDTNRTKQLIENIKTFCNRMVIYQQCKVINDLEYAFQIINLHQNQQYKSLLNYIMYINEIKDSHTLIDVNSKVIAAQQELQNLRKMQIDIEKYIILSRCQDVYHFSIASDGQNFNDLYEKLEDNEMLSSSTINDMNVVAQFFLSLKREIEKIRKDLDFIKLLKFLGDSLQHQLDSDKTFNARLTNVTQNLDIIKNVNNEATNLAQNTLKIVHSCFENGSVGFTQTNNNYDLWIEYRINNQPLMLNLEQIIQHSSRAILLGSSEQNAGSFEELKQAQSEVSYEDINMFVEIIQISHDARALMNELFTFGHLDHQAPDQTEVMRISRSSIRQDLLGLKENLQTKLKQWKTELRELRHRYYYLTYIPNRKLHSLIQYIYKHELQSELKEEIYQIFRFINNEFDPKTIDNQRLNSANEIRKSNSDKLQELGKWLDDNFKNIRERPKPIPQFHRNNQMKNAVIRKGKIQFYSVEDNNELIQAIIAIYTLMEYVPMASEILFCNNNTKIHEVESFILRAILIPPHLSQKRKKMFLIADFQALPLRTQISAYSFMQKMETQLQQRQESEYYLTVLFQKRNQKVMQKEDIIEELQNKESFTGFIDNDLTKAFFQTFSKIAVLHSNTTGLGKSKYALNQANTERIDYKRIPIFGELTREKFVNLHKNKKIQISQQSKYGIHYDIYPTSRESLNIILFEALILNCVQIDNKIYHFPDNSFYYLELSQEVLAQYQRNEFFFNNFKPLEFVWDSNKIEIDLDMNSDIQLVAKYMDALQRERSDGTKISIDQLHAITEPIPQGRCIELLDHFLLNQVQRPNFYVLRSYLAFAGDNLRKLQVNPFFLSDEILKYQFDNQGYGFYVQIITMIIELSKKLCQVENSLQKQGIERQMYEALKTEKDKDKIKLIEQEYQAMLLQDMSWERNNALFIMINDEGSITPIYKNPQEIPEAVKNYIKQLARFYQQQRKDANEILNEIKPFEQLDQDFIVQKILRMCGNEQDRVRIQQVMDLKRLVFTNDNFLKMALIYQRLRTSQPVVIMGETGVGKTAVINYLADLIDYEFKVLNVHAGITEQTIIEFVQGVNEFSKLNPGRRTIVFFDEVNTNTNVQGLFKEIMIDRHLLGEPIHANIRIASACNPYKLKSQSAIENSISAGIKHQKMDPNVSRLVYTVQPLPESILSYIWDYGSLNQEEEKKYIWGMIKTMKSESEVLRTISESDISFIANCVYKSQDFIRQSDAQWAVSLRDVDRFRKLFIYFSENTYGNYRSKERSFVLAISFCYLFRISKKEKRQAFVLMLINDRNGDMRLTVPIFQKILEDEYKVFLDKIEIPPGIGKNTPLKENIFVMVTCILNKIPLFITGKPGSSKTLALNLVTKSMKGQASSENFFKQFPSVISFTYQGSVQSTSIGIERIFERAIKFNKDKEERKEELGASMFNQQEKSNKSIALVVIDEIGLAEISPHNPLKILHSLLEPPQVSFIGISNWSLDASKMNRAITLSRPDAKINDLMESASAISEEVNRTRQQGDMHHRGFQSTFLRKLVQSYYEYHGQQLKENFHGLRDFYSLVSQLCLQFNHIQARQNMEVLKKSILRNFGGQDIDLVIRNFQQQFGNVLQFEQIQTTSMIMQNLEDPNSRHLMIITENEEQNAIQFIEGYFNSKQIEYRIFYGSDFSEDQQEESAYKQIHDIILCMERGIYVVLLNLDYIYQSFYDMLNQNYQIIGGQRFCKVAIGSDSSRKLVHPDFKCILITSKDQVDKMDAPLLNRFEKQLYSMEQNLTPQERNIIQETIEWVLDITNVKEFSTQQCFPMINNLKNTIIQIIKNLQSSKVGERDIKLICQNYLIQVCTHAGIIRSQQFKRESSLNCIQEYFENQKHFKLIDFIRDLTQTWKDDYFYNESQKGFNVVVQTYTSLTQDLFRESIQHLPSDSPIILSNVSSQRLLDQMIENYFKITNKTELLYLFADSSTDSNMRISLCKNIINNHRANYKRYVEYPPKHVCLIIKVTDKYEGITNFGQGWRDYFIDLINGKGNTEIEVEKLVKLKLSEVFNDDTIFKDLLVNSLNQIISRIRYNLQNNANQVQNDNLNQDEINTNCFQVSRIRELQSLIESSAHQQLIQDIKTQFNELVVKNEKIDEIDNSWQLKICNDKVSMIANQYFHASAVEFLREMVIRYSRAIFYFMENYGVFNSYFKTIIDRVNEKKEPSRDMCYLVFQEECLTIQNFNQSYILQKPNCFQMFPYIILIDRKFQSMKQVFKSQIRQLELRRDVGTALSQNLDNLKTQSDANIVEYINTLKLQCGSTFPEYLKFSRLLTDFNDDYLLDLPDIYINGMIDKKYHQIFHKLIRMTVKNRIEDVYTIYAALWINERFIDRLWNLYSNNKELIKEENLLTIIDNMEQQINIENENLNLNIITTYYLEDALLVSLYNHIKLTQEIIGLNQTDYNQISQWAQRIDKLLVDLRDLNFLQSTKQMKTLEFQTRFCQQLVVPLSLNSEIVMSIVDKFVNMLDPFAMFKNINDWISEQARNGIVVDQIIYKDYVYGFLEEQFQDIIEEKKLPFMKKCFDLIFFDLKKFQVNDFILIVQSIIKKIVSIVYNSSQQTFEHYLTQEQPPNADEYMSVLTHFIAKIEGNIGHPLCILLTDSIEQIFETQQYDFDYTEVRHYLENSLQIMFDDSIDPLKRIIAIAFVRRICKVGIDQFIHEFNEKRDPTSTIITVFNGFISQSLPDNQKIEHILIIFIMKLLLSRSLSMNEISEQVSAYMPWTKVQNMLASMKVLSYVKNKEFFNQILFCINKRPEFRQKLQQFINDYNSNSTIYLAILQYYYLNNKQDSADIAQEVRTFTNGFPIYQNFLKSIIKNTFDPMSTLFQRRDHYLPELLGYTMIMSQNSSELTIFKELQKDMKRIEGIFIPFIANTRQDFNYKVIFDQEDINKMGSINKGIRRYRCVKCGEIIIVGDCGQLSNEWNRNGQQNGTAACPGCGVLVGYGHQANLQPLEGRKVFKETFSTDNEAIKGYIILDPEQNQVLLLRGMNDIARQIGYIITHCVFLNFFIFSSQQQQLTIPKYVISQRREERKLDAMPNDEKLNLTLQFMKRQIEYTWGVLREVLNLNDERLLKIFEHTLQLMMEHSYTSPLTQLQVFETIEGRKEFEKFFQENCVVGLQDNFSSFFSNLENNSEDPMLQQLDEKDNMGNYPNDVKILKQHFRMQVKINERTFFNNLYENNTKEAQFIKMVHSQIDQVAMLCNLKPLINWANYIKAKFNGKIKKEEAFDIRIDDLINMLDSDDEKQTAKIIFSEFEKAWNQFKDREIVEGCDRIKIYEILNKNDEQVDQRPRFQQFCLTKNTRDSLGYTYYLLIRLLYSWQNDFLKRVEGILQVKPRTSYLLQLRTDQMVTDRIDQEYLEKLVQRNSFNDINYGTGRLIHYNIESIYQNLYEKLVMNKSYIEEDVDLDFQYQNLGQLYFIYDEITMKINQIRIPEIKQIFNNNDIQVNEKCQFHNQLLIALSFLSQTGGNPESTVIEYMRAFGLQSPLLARIGYGARLKHILHLYEIVEESILDVLVEKTHQKYKQELPEDQKEILIDTIQDDSTLRQTVKVAVGRLCYRQFMNQDITDEANLFGQLFDEFNIYLHGIESNVDLQELLNKFMNCQATTGHGYSLYQTLKQQEKLIEEQKKEEQIQQEKLRKVNEEKAEQRRQDVSNQNDYEGFDFDN